MSRAIYLGTAAALLLAGWALALGRGGFAAHMAAHMVGVAVAAPLLVLGIGRRPGLLNLPGAALLACGVELLVVWGWHAPALHAAARGHAGIFALEQLSFLLAGFAVWASALPAGDGPRGGSSALAGVGALLMTSMHMSLLGGLLAVAGRPWYHQGAEALWDQQLGGVIMLALGGLAYLAGALVLLGRALHEHPPGARAATPPGARSQGAP